MILDAQNRRVAVFPVMDLPLDDPANYAALKALLLSSARESGGVDDGL